LDETGRSGAVGGVTFASRERRVTRSARPCTRAGSTEPCA
jgi:hypothetical protein